MNGGAGLGQAIAMLIAAPVMALVDYFAWIKQQPAGQQELAKACHGVGMLAVLVFWFAVAGGFDEVVFELAAHPANPLAWLPLGIAAWGLGWFLINARFAAQSIGRPQRATLPCKNAAKFRGATFESHEDANGFICRVLIEATVRRHRRSSNT